MANLEIDVLDTHVVITFMLKNEDGGDINLTGVQANDVSIITNEGLGSEATIIMTIVAPNPAEVKFSPTANFFKIGENYLKVAIDWAGDASDMSYTTTEFIVEGL